MGPVVTRCSATRDKAMQTVLKILEAELVPSLEFMHSSLNLLLLDVAADAKNGTLTQARVDELKGSYASFDAMLKEVASDHEQIKQQLAEAKFVPSEYLQVLSKKMGRAVELITADKQRLSDALAKVSKDVMK